MVGVVLIAVGFPACGGQLLSNVPQSLGGFRGGRGGRGGGFRGGRGGGGGFRGEFGKSVND